jgi:hypothetical protein
VYLHSLELQNIKCFDTLSFEFGRPDGSYAGLSVLVGGNASGKSTILRAIAMALSGPQVSAQLLGAPMGWVRDGSPRGKIDAEVQWDVAWDKFKESGKPPANPIETGLILTQGQPDSNPTIRPKYPRSAKQGRIISAERGPWNPAAGGWFLAAYGPFRRLTGSSTDAVRYALAPGKVSSCVTLFREDAALSESESWLRQAHARELEAAARNAQPTGFVDNVRQFLNAGLLPDGLTIARVTVDEVLVGGPTGQTLPMRDLSDGCRSAFALMLDLVHHMEETYGADGLFCSGAGGALVVNKPGVVLVDEIEAHLHPAWQSTICEWLRTRFPKVQFIVTTHSPLVAQAADPGGIFVLPLPGELGRGRSPRRLTTTEEERIVMARAEKVLLGEAFGLRRTWSDRAQRKLDEWERLAAQEARLGGLTGTSQKRKLALDPQIRSLFDFDSEV